MMERDVVRQSSPVVWERGTVMDLETVVSMMETEAVRVTSSVAVTTVRSSELTTIRRTTAVTCLRIDPVPQLQSSFPGLP